ncbi:MAG: hypothetical protein IPK82_05405 [Polyangiaceae bacterium]|nr:hypothetical protein [Polyangiaceae bacterium]
MGSDESEPSEPGDDDPPDSANLRPRCPRCGGIGEPPRYRPRANPFLFKPKPGHLVCEDCGLDYWDSSQGPPPSSKSPW